MKLTSVTISGMHNIKHRTYNLSNLNYFLGKNGAGKSTVLQAIQLALLGYIPGTNKQTSAIFKHSNSTAMTVGVTLDDEGTQVAISRTWSLDKGRVVSTASIQPSDYSTDDIIGDLELPIFNFSEFMNMSANQIKDWFINFLPSAEFDIDWDTKLRDQISDLPAILDPEFVENMIHYAKCLKGDTLPKVRELHDYFKSQMSFLKGSLSRIEGTIQSLVYYNDIDDDESEEGVQKQIDDLSAEKAMLINKYTKASHNKRIESVISSTKDRINADSLENDETYIKLSSDLAGIEDKLKQINASRRELMMKSNELQRDIADMDKIINSGGVCPYTSSQCESIVDIMDKYKIDKSAKLAEIRESNKSLSDLDMECNGLEVERHNIQTELRAIEGAYSSYNTAMAGRYSDVDNVDLDMTDQLIAEITEKIEGLTDKLVKIRANEQYNQLQSKMTQEKFVTEQNLEISKIWSKFTDMNGIQSDIVKAPFEALSDRITDHLKKLWNDDNISAKFFLSNKANSFNFGIEHKQSRSYIPFDLLSSGEKCMFTLALFMSIIENSTTKLPLILVDDLLDHLDDGRIDEVFNALYSESNIQIILAGVKPCNHPNNKEFVKEVQ